MWRYAALFFLKIWCFFFKKRLWHFFVSKFEGFEKNCGTMWRYVALFFLKFSFFFHKAAAPLFYLEIWRIWKKSVALCGAMWPQFFPRNLMFFKNRLWHYVALCGVIFPQNLMFFKNRLWHYFLLKFKGFEKQLWHYVALCGAILSQIFIFFSQSGCATILSWNLKDLKKICGTMWRYVAPIFSSKFDVFQKSAVALCGAIWPQFFPQNLMFFKNRLWHYFLLKFKGFEKQLWHYVALCGAIFLKIWRVWPKTLALCGAMWRYFFSKFDVFFSENGCGTIFA